MHWDPLRGARLALLHDARFALHAPQGHHPERPARLQAALDGAARAAQSAGSRVVVDTRDATRDELARAHDPAYLDRLDQALAGPAGYLDPDTYYGAGSREAAWRAAGSGCAMVEALLDDRADVAMLIARPPGHHATRTRAMGFCLLNNIAVAARHARALGCPRVAIVDWDVHHGNGTQDIFDDDPSVLFVSIHQAPLYPDSGWVQEVGVGGGRGYSVNLPMSAGCDGALYARAFERIVLPVVDAFAPSLILVSAGFDGHARDPLASMILDEHDYRWMASRLRALAVRHGEGRMGLFLEGGYDLGALERSVADALLGAMSPHEDPHPDVHDDASAIAAKAILDPLVRVHQAFWPVLK